MDLVGKFLKIRHKHATGRLSAVVKDIEGKKAVILAAAKKSATPFYLLDPPALKKGMTEFETAFQKHLSGSRFFYAIKSNPHPYILESALKQGWGLDASSGRELEFALKAGAKQILFTGPGKTEEELKLAIKHADRVILNIDNFCELSRLAKLLRGKKIRLRAGVRFFSSFHESWSKFGVPLKDINKFWLTAKKIPNLELQGIQFHSSLNRYPDRHIKIIAELGIYLRKKFPQKFLKEIKFIDIGGGYYPDRIEGYYPWSSAYPWVLSPGHFQKLAGDYFGKKIKFKQPYYITRAAVPEKYAAAVSRAISKNLKSIISAEYFLEPGRIVSAKSMHLVMRIIDVKDGLAITDGGINMAGWEFGREFYMPIINLTNFSRKEIAFPIHGSLCTPRDFWGYYIYAKKVAPGDVIVIPNQGAYRFTLAQEFIKPIPPVHL